MALRASATKANQLMREVVAATRLGQKNLARGLLRQLQDEDPNNEQALLWSAALAESPEEATGYLERVLEVNPNNQQAINVLAMHRLNPAAARAATPVPIAERARMPERREPENLRPEPAPAPRTAEAWRQSGDTWRPAESRWREQPAAEPEPEEPRPAAAPAPAPERAAEPESRMEEGAPKPHAEPPAPAASPSRVVNFHELLKKSWSCPLCDAHSPTLQRKCPSCGALLSLDDLAALADNRGADEKVLHTALEQWTRRNAAEPTFESWLNLARVYLNLNRSAEALPCLKKACELRPAETGLQLAASRLEQRSLVLAVDDSLTLRRILSITLERLGYRVMTAADGMQALALLNEQVPDLILLDITMPRMDGYQVCKVIRQNPYTRHVPVVMLSGNDGFFDKVKGRLAGAADYITKPFEEKSLAASVEKHLKASARSGR